jgi:hypothetical protein
VGFGLGNEVSPAVGSEVGIDVRSAVGLAIGFVVGLAVGSDVGVSVGTTVGSEDGFEVGKAIGIEVGVLVGPAVGMAVGDVVDFAVDSMDGTRFTVGPRVGFPVTEIDVDTTDITAVAVGFGFADTNGLVVIGDLVPVTFQIAGEMATPPSMRPFGCCNDGFIFSGSGEGTGEALFDKAATGKGEIDSNGALAGNNNGIVLFSRTSAVIDVMFSICPPSIKLFMKPLKTWTNWAAPLCAGAARTAQKHVLLLTTNPSSRRFCLAESRTTCSYGKRFRRIASLNNGDSLGHILQLPVVTTFNRNRPLFRCWSCLPIKSS